MNTKAKWTNKYSMHEMDYILLSDEEKDAIKEQRLKPRADRYRKTEQRY